MNSLWKISNIASDLERAGIRDPDSIEVIRHGWLFNWNFDLPEKKRTVRIEIGINKQKAQPQLQFYIEIVCNNTDKDEQLREMKEFEYDPSSDNDYPGQYGFNFFKNKIIQIFLDFTYNKE